MIRVQSKKEHDFAYGVIKEKEMGPTFIDGTDVEKEGTWVYSNGDPVKYLKWRKNEPGRFPDAEHALAIWGGPFCDVATDKRSSYIIEWDE